MKKIRLRYLQPDHRVVFGLLLAAAMLLAACGGGGGGTPTAESGATPSGGGGTGAGLCANDFFPVVNGATWTYGGTGPSGDFSWTSTITDVSGSNFTLTNQFTNLTATQQWSCTSEGLAALQYGSGPEAMLSASGINGTFETTDTTGVTFPAHISAGDTWTQTFTIHGDMNIASGQTATADGTVTQDYTAVGTESVTVPAGTFEAMKLEVNLHMALQIVMGEGVTVPVNVDTQTTNWWVAGIGWVKSLATASVDGGDAIDTTTELQSYNIP